MKFNHLALVSLLLLSACSSDAFLSDVDEGVEIELSSGVVHQVAVATSRGSGILGETVTSGDLPISLVRIDQLPGGTYPTGYTDASVVHLNAELPYRPDESAGRIRLRAEDAQFYPFDGRKTKFFGWYPQSGAWTAATGKVVFPTIDGSTDIRIAHGVEGSKLKDERFTDTDRTLSFAHVLTMVKVFIRAEKAEYIPLWGDVTKIEFVGKQQSCSLTFPSPSGSTITPVFSGTADLTMIAKGGTTEHEDLPLSVGAHDDDYTEVGYAMFAPHAGSTADLVLRITTDPGGVQPLIRIPYAQAKMEPGKMYYLKLLFRAVEITPSGVIEAWVPDDTLLPIPIG